MKRIDDEERKTRAHQDHQTQLQSSATVASDTLHFSDDSMDEESPVVEPVPGTSSAPEEPTASSEAKAKAMYNCMDIPTVATQSIRYGVGLRATAAVATAALIDAGLISQEDPQLVIDKNKVRRAQGKAIKTLSANFDVECTSIECIFFDGRIDQTNAMTTVESVI
jgi:hypothetical protein